MLSSPITITIDGTAHSLDRINQDNYGSVYLKRTATMELRLVLRHSYEGKVSAGQFERHNADLTMTTWDADGNPVVTQTYVVFRTPRNVDPDRLTEQLIGFDNFVNANAAALVGWAS